MPPRSNPEKCVFVVIRVIFVWGNIVVVVAAVLGVIAWMVAGVLL